MATNSYTKIGATQAISATASSSQIYVAPGPALVSLLFTNADPANVAFVSFGTTSSVTATTAGFPVPPLSPTVVQVAPPEVFTGNVTVAAVTAAGTATVYVTPVA